MFYDRIIPLVLAGSLFLAPAVASGQETTEPEPRLPLNTVYFELAGSGLIYSVNYDRVINDQFSIRVGAAAYGSSDFAFPILANYLLGSGPSRLELGIGVSILSITFTFFDSTEQLDRAIGTASIAYRYQHPDKRLFFKAGLTPLYNTKGFLPWVGASLGYTFN